MQRQRKRKSQGKGARFEKKKERKCSKTASKKAGSRRIGKRKKILRSAAKPKHQDKNAPKKDLLAQLKKAEEDKKRAIEQEEKEG